MEQYFIPDIQDIRVGYECELMSISIPQWSKWVIPKLDWESFEGSTIEDYLELGNIKVPYLTKEQIEAEGWEIEEKINGVIGRKGSYDSYMYSKPKPFTIEYVFEEKLLLVLNDFIIYRGECKDINTFRYICKLLKIN